MEIASFVVLVTSILSVASAFLGVKYRHLVNKAKLFSKLLGELIVAIEDDNLSENEVQQLIMTAKELMESNG
ncbi:MAG: hypothetical protein NWF06_10050 [Candidatus Bathyarchaeota archaeon]|nr:hypothetical protein [Candidatus Bathyarchaeum sp.]